ncbi:hypothetical protein FQZ97_614740 [compost metagenome]
MHHADLVIQRPGGGRQALDHGNVLLRDLVELEDGRVDLTDARGLLLAGVVDVFQRIRHAADGVHHLVHAGTGLVGALLAQVHTLPGLFDEHADFLGGLGGALGQRAHFAGDHGEALALFARSRRLDGGIERQDVGLECHAFDNLDDVADALRRPGNLVHGRHHVLHGLVAALRGADRLARHVGARLGHAGGLPHGAVDLLDGGCGFFEAAGLRFRARGHVAVAAGDLARAAAQMGDLFAHIAHHGAHGHRQLGQRQLQLADFGLAVDPHVLGEIAGGQHVGGRNDFAHRLDADADQVASRQHGGDQARQGRHPLRRAIGLADEVRQRRHRGHTEGRQNNVPAQAKGEQAAETPEQAVVQHGAVMQHVHTAAALSVVPHVGVQRFGFLDFVLWRVGAHGQVTDNAFAVAHGRGVGAHPVVIAIFAAVLDQGRPGQARLDGFPHVAEGFFRHIGVAHQIMGLADQFSVRKAADLDEIGIAISDAPFQIRDRNKCLIRRKIVTGLGNRQIGAHSMLHDVRHGQRAFSRVRRTMGSPWECRQSYTDCIHC